MVGQEVGDALRGGLHGRLAFLPLGGADVAMLLEELQRVHHADHLVDVAPQRQVIDHLMANDALTINQERTAQGHGVIHQHIVVAGDAFGEIRYHGHLHLADATLCLRGILPGQMGIMGIDAARHDFAVAGLELRQAVVEGEDLRRADEGEVQGVEEQHPIFALDVVRKLELLIDAVIGHDGSGDEVWSGFSYEYGHGDFSLLQDRIKSNFSILAEY